MLEIAQVDHGVLGAEDLRGTRLLRHAAAMRKTAVPRGLAAFEVRAFAAARARGLAFAALARRLDHAAAVPAADARAFGIGPGSGFKLRQFHFPHSFRGSRRPSCRASWRLPRPCAAISGPRSSP